MTYLSFAYRSLVVAAVFAGCKHESATHDDTGNVDEGASTSADDDGVSETGDGDSSGSGSSSSSGTAGVVTDTSGSSSSAGDETTTGTAPAGLEDACMAYCTKVMECAPDEADPVDECTAACTADITGRECIAAAIDLLDCLVALDCEAFVSDTPQCVDQSDAVDAACSNEVCEMGVGGDGETCSATEQCPDEPAREIDCDATTCTCTEDGTEVATCPSNGVCSDDQALVDLAADCCPNW